MIFNDRKAIYQQIADYVCGKILQGEWPPGSRILSVRELGAKLEVNSNTVLRGYDFLQQQAIIVNKRGVGYFSTSDSKEKVLAMLKERFIEEEIPILRKNLELLDMSFEELRSLLNG